MEFATKMEKLVNFQISHEGTKVVKTCCSESYVYWIVHHLDS